MQNVSVLLVEDEALLLLELEHAVQEGGYNPVSATSGEAAIAKLEAPNDFRAVATDINLGGEKTGWDVARRARELTPDIPVVYVTSVSTAEWSANGVPKSILIGKPFAPAQLITAISQLLNASDTPPSLQ